MWVTSRKPSVVIIPALAPLYSRIALVATVVPWMRRPRSFGSTPAWRQSSPIPSTIVALVSPPLESFRTEVSPASLSKRTKSVKVPPTSIPIVFMLLLPLSLGFGGVGGREVRGGVPERSVGDGERRLHLGEDGAAAVACLAGEGDDAAALEARFVGGGGHPPPADHGV